MPREPEDTPSTNLYELMQAATPDLDVPREVAARAEARLRTHWRRRTRQRRQRRIAIYGGLALAASLLLVLVWRHPATAPPAPGVATIVRIASESGASNWNVGDVVLADQELSTDVDTRLALRRSDGASLRLDVDSRLRWRAPGIVELLDGALYFDSGPEVEQASRLTVHTVRGTVRDIGTQFMLRISGQNLSLRVREGRVDVDSGEGSHRVESGSQLLLSPGSVVTSPISRSGSPWAWVLEVAPPPDEPWRTLDVYLMWLQKETGLQSHFTEPEIAAQAAEIEIFGPLQDLRPDHTMDAVLASCGLKGYVEDGMLKIEPR